MKIKLQYLDIDSQNPFANDSLERIDSAETLTQFIKNLDEPYVISVDSPWGTGKTTFLKMWQFHLKQKNISSVYFNAWENDFSDDALVSLIKEIELDKSFIKKNSKSAQYFAIAKEAGYLLLRNAIPAAIKLATFGALDTTKITEDAVASVTEELAKEQFSAYENSKKSLLNFRENLEKFAGEIVKENEGPLVFIIDELDRCRPDFAIKVLEKVKHLFSVKNIVFILGIDKKQLGFSMKTLYGSEMDVEGYLNRFIDLDYYLPVPDKKAFIKKTLERHNTREFFILRDKYPNLKYDNNGLNRTILYLSELFGFSLRQIEQIISHIVIVIKLTNENEFLHPELLCFLLALRKRNSGLYKHLLENKVEPEILIEKLKKELRVDKLIINFEMQYIIGYLEFSKMYDNKGYDAIKKYKNITENLSSSEDEKADAERMLSILNDLDWRHPANLVVFLAKKIEIAQNFK